MLVLSRKAGQRIHIGNDIVLTVVRVQGNQVRIGVEAPQEVNIHREECRPVPPSVENGALAEELPAYCTGVTL